MDRPSFEAVALTSFIPEVSKVKFGINLVNLDVVDKDLNNC